MWRYSLFIIFLFSGCYLPVYLEYSSKLTFIQYFKDQNVCVVVGSKRFADKDTSWIDERCLHDNRAIIDAQKAYLDINDSSALVDLLIDSLKVSASRSCEILDDTVYYVYYFAPSPCCVCNYAFLGHSGPLRWLHGFWIITRGGRIMHIVGIPFYS